MNKKVIFLISQTFDQRNYQRFGVENWKDAGWHVEVWDMTPLLFPKVWYYNLSRGIENFDNSSIILIKAKNEIPIIEKTDGISLFVDIINNWEPLYLRVKRLLYESGWSCLFLNLGSRPEPEINFTAKLKIILFSRQSNILKYLNFKCFNTYYKKFLDRTYIAVSGNRTFQKALSLTRFENIVKAYNFDYDNYIGNASKPYQTGIAVFLDEDLAYHVDDIMNGIPSIVSAERYYPALKGFFSVFEKNLGVKIIIAAHPRSSYINDRYWCYEGFQVEKNNTANLVQKADFVIAHASTSLQLAVIYNKPIFLITSDEIMRTRYQNLIEEFSKTLGSVIINVDKVKQFENISIESVDLGKYKEYIYSHMTMLNHDNGRLWDIIIREMEIRLKHNISLTKKDDNETGLEKKFMYKTNGGWQK